MPMAVQSSVIWAKPRIGMASPETSTGMSIARATATTAVVAAAAARPATRPCFQTGWALVGCSAGRVVGAVVTVAVIGRLLGSGPASPTLTVQTNGEVENQRAGGEFPSGRTSRTYGRAGTDDERRSDGRPGDHHRGVHRCEGPGVRRGLPGAVHLRVRSGE